MDKVNIIMATYQGETYIGEQIDSILRSTYADFMLSIYDDGSKDRTIEIVKSYQEKYPDKVQLIQNTKNLGHLKNFMQGVINNPYDYVMFCDQDDVWKSDKIADTYKCMKRAEAKQKKVLPMVVFTDAEVVDEKLQTIHTSFHQSNGLDTSKLNFAAMLMENKMMGCTMMLNRPLIGKIKTMPDQARYHDWWIGLIAASFGQIIYLSKSTMLYRQHGNNVVGNQTFKTYVMNRIRNLKEQKRAIQATLSQAYELQEYYGDIMPQESLRILQQFLMLKNAGPIKKRVLLFKNGFLKSGLARNIGLFLII